MLLLLAGAAGLPAQGQAPSPAAPLFREKPFGPKLSVTPTPIRKTTESPAREPLSTAWIVGGSAALALALVALFLGAVRQWRSSNLFDREYRFPIEGEPAMRFGAKRSGGHLARVSFGERDTKETK